MSDSEHLRETLIALRRENERLRVEASHATLVYRALEALLRVEMNDDPFSGVFSALHAVFEFTQAMVLAEGRREHLDCIAATPPALIGSRWKIGGLFRRVMNGRVSVTISNEELEEWRHAPPELDARQPALYLPIRVRTRRGLLMLLQPVDGPGFDRDHVALAKKFALLASHALAVREASETGAELRRQKEIEVQNMRFDAALNNMTHGLAMFDADRRLVVCNDQYIRMYGLSRDEVRPGCTLLEVLEQRKAGGSVSDDVENYMAFILDSVTTRDGEEQEVECGDGRIFLIINRQMPDGGWVSTHEDITERRRDEMRIKYLALSDPLTGIANRTHFIDHVELARRRLQETGQPFSVLILDLDRFKDINDTLGHAAGDVLLKESARRLKLALRDSDVLARLGGDEFAVLQAPPRDYRAGSADTGWQREGAIALASRILDLIRLPFDIDGHAVYVGTSIGIAMAPDDAVEAGDLMKKADLALYEVKSLGRNGFSFFDPKMTLEADERRQLEKELREGLQQNSFELYYQPIVDVATRTTIGAEALVRWNHPRYGLISPDRFIPVAEDTGLIVPLGEWIVNTACKDAAAWPIEIKVAVNISPNQFVRANLLGAILDALAASGLPPQRLELEITERLLMERNADHLSVLEELRRRGVSIALDDFGTGYSSLSYLTMFPFDKIKIDKSFTNDFVERADCAAIVSAVVGLGRALDIVTLAEGVETQEQFELLRIMGLTQAQGFLFNRPMPAAVFRSACRSAESSGQAA